MNELTGRKLDAAVAGRICDYTQINDEPCPLTTSKDGPILIGWHGLDTCGEVEPIPHYSTTWNGAGLVIAEMRKLGWTVYCGPMDTKKTLRVDGRDYVKNQF